MLYYYLSTRIRQSKVFILYNLLQLYTVIIIPRRIQVFLIIFEVLLQYLLQQMLIYLFAATNTVYVATNKYQHNYLACECIYIRPYKPGPIILIKSWLYKQHLMKNWWWEYCKFFCIDIYRHCVYTIEKTKRERYNIRKYDEKL